MRTRSIIWCPRCRSICEPVHINVTASCKCKAVKQKKTGSEVQQMINPAIKVVRLSSFTADSHMAKLLVELADLDKNM